jgi:hypothetical protein
MDDSARNRGVDLDVAEVRKNNCALYMVDVMRET